MPTESEWADAITAAAATRLPSTTALTYLGPEWASFSRPVVLSCSDGNAYVVKGRQVGRAIVNEHIVGRLGMLLSAPVGEVAVVEITDALKAIEPKIAHVPAGLAHGSQFVSDCTDKLGLGKANLTENRDRFARLAVLYSWTVAGDHQFIYRKADPPIVYSVDHGHFFPGGPNWTMQALAQVPAVAIDGTFSPCGITAAEYRAPRLALEQIRTDDITRIVAGPPDEWGMSINERVAVAMYLTRRQADLVNLLAALP